MNARIGSLFRLFALGTAVLVTMTAYWQIWAAPSLAVRKDNARLVYRQLTIKRGLIYATNGSTVLATNTKHVRNGQTLYLRKYPFKGLYAHAVGYNTIGQGRTGLELSYNDYLTASNNDLSTLVGNLGDQLTGRTVTGNNLITALSPAAQRAAVKGLGALKGAVVALDPHTGQVLAMASNPTFDPNSVGRNIARLSTGTGAPLLNRATQGLYAPGSTFKIVTTTAALQSHKYTPDTLIDGKGSCITVESHQLCNAGGEVAGVVSLRTALTNSYNTVFAQVGQAVGQSRLEATMRAYGFFEKPPLDYPDDEMAASGLYGPHGLLRPGVPEDVGRVAIGQERLLATPLQMAEVAATVANSGVRMRPWLVRKVVAPGGKTVLTNGPQAEQRVMSPQTAAELTSMMRDVVEEGTGQSANIGGLNVAGKTGTAETGVAGLNNAWFIAFAPVEHPQIAVAAVIERTPEFGGTIAAPIAARVIAAYLGQAVAK